MKNPSKLTSTDIEQAFDNDGLYGIKVEESEMLFYQLDNYAAVYAVTLEDDGSFPEESDRHAQVYIKYTSNGTLVASF
jgi:hypothetical protein